jgi:hypothetical protein
MKSDEEYYLAATREAEGQDRNVALWAKSIALCEGDNEKAKYKYINLRVEQLKNSSPSEPIKPEPIFTKKVIDEFSLAHMPVSEFARIKGIPEKKIIEMIRDGFYMGQIRDGSWFVNRQEVKKEDIRVDKNRTPTPKQTKNEYVPVEEFAEHKGMTSEKVIQMIKDGLYVGRIIDEKWHVSFSEIEGHTQNAADSSDVFSWTKWALYAQVGISIVAIISGMMEYELLSNFKSGNFVSESSAIAAAESNDSRQDAVGIIQFLVFIISGIIILKWIYRANLNARKMGAENMLFTPGWSIGWYFVPIANLWKPYQAMKEIWMATKNPQNWKTVSVSSLLPWWWFIWIVSNLIANASFKLAMKAEELNQLIMANIVTLASDVAGIVLSLIFLSIVKQIYEYQDAGKSSI